MIQGEKTRWRGPASEEAIADAERRLGVCFPAEYREFLATHGSGIVDGVEIFGLGGPKGGMPDLDFVLAGLERRGFVRPRGLIPIAEVGNGDYVAVLAEPLGGHGVGEVVYWEPMRGGEVRVTPAAGGFVAWVEGARRGRKG